MSREAIGANNRILGSREYWESLNDDTILRHLMSNTAQTNYEEVLRDVGNRAQSAVEEIYNDLQQHIKYMQAIPSDCRNALAKQVEELYDVCSMAGIFCSHKKAG